MLRLIIVDDEKVIRETIQSIIDWDSLGIEVIGLCKNGIQAYDMILDEYPDVVLTDIQMPGLSGLELIERITKVGTDTEFVILSGYGDFAYAKLAMKYGIQHYLLKPCNEKEIVDVLQQVKTKCWQKQVKNATKQEQVLMLKTLHESAMKDLLQEANNAQANFEALAEQYEPFLNFTGVPYELYITPLSEQSEALRVAFVEYHQVHAPSIPVSCFSVGNSLCLSFESYDYDYRALDALFEMQAQYERQSYAQLYNLLQAIHTLVVSQGEMHVYEVTKLIAFATPDDANDDLTDAFAQNIMEYVRTHIDDPALSLKYIAESVLFMNVDYVSKKFVKGAGKRFSVFLAEERIACAKKMLQEKPYPVNMVAQAVGCQTSPDYFSKLFKKYTGVTPSDYRKKIGCDAEN